MGHPNVSERRGRHRSDHSYRLPRRCKVFCVRVKSEDRICIDGIAAEPEVEVIGCHPQLSTVVYQHCLGSGRRVTRFCSNPIPLAVLQLTQPVGTASPNCSIPVLDDFAHSARWYVVSLRIGRQMAVVQLADSSGTKAYPKASVPRSIQGPY